MKTEIKNLRHTFTSEEKTQLGMELAWAIGALRGIDADFGNVKASFKAKTAAAEAQTYGLITSITAGFEMRNKRCVVVFRPKDRKKDFFIEESLPKAAGEPDVDFAVASGIVPDATEEMTKDDYQADLIEAESKFDNREELALFTPTELDRGTLIVGRFAGKWFSALRVKIGKLELEERLDIEQKSYPTRHDSIKAAVLRVKEWANTNMRDHAKGFEASFDAVVQAHKERVE